MEGFVFYLGIFGVVILISALLSRAVERTPFSQTMVFVALGLLLGPPGLGWIHFDLESPVIEGVLLLTLVLVLFTDGMKISPGDLRTDWVLPARALGPGILLTTLMITGAAIALLGLDPLQSLLLAVILAPTDPVLVSVILEDERIPRKVRQALSVESGLNDGVAISAVLLLMDLLSIRGGDNLTDQVATFAAQLGLGPLVGLAVGFVGVRALEWVRDRVGLRQDYESLYPLGLAFAAYAAATAVGGSGFLAAFVAGVTASSLDVELCDCFHEYGEATARMLMMLTFVLFGSSLVPMSLPALSWQSVAFTAFLLFVARPVAIFLAMIRAPASLAAKGFIAWFGPRGVASIVLSILPVAAGLPGGEEIFALTSLVVLASVVLHGISAAPLAGWYARRSEARTLPEQLVARLQPGTEGGGLPVGAAAPDFRLPAAGGGQIALSEVLARGPVLLLFYRGHWCSHCWGQLSQLRQVYGRLRTLGAEVVAVSADPVPQAEKLAADLELPFPVLSDADRAVIRAYDVEHPSEGIARPATFLLDPTGRIHFRYVGHEAADRSLPETVIAALERMTERKGGPIPETR